LDYIFLRHGNKGWQIQETKHLHEPPNPHSDHRSLLTRLAMNPA
jgi:hypothetical protein